DARQESERNKKEYEARRAKEAETLKEAAMAPAATPAFEPTPPHELVRRNPFAKPGEELKRVEGIAKNIDCSGKFAKFQIQSGSHVLTFDMSEPNRILLKHEGAETYDFQCGPQKAFRVAVEYVPAAKPGGSAGIMRQLEF